MSCKRRYLRNDRSHTEEEADFEGRRLQLSSYSEQSINRKKQKKRKKQQLESNIQRDSCSTTPPVSPPSAAGATGVPPSFTFTMSHTDNTTHFSFPSITMNTSHHHQAAVIGPAGPANASVSFVTSTTQGPTKILGRKQSLKTNQGGTGGNPGGSGGVAGNSAALGSGNAVVASAGTTAAIGGLESFLADYGPEESLNESADIEWVNKLWVRRLMRGCALVSLASVSLNTPKTFERVPLFQPITFTIDSVVTFLFSAEMIAKMHIRGILKVCY